VALPRRHPFADGLEGGVGGQRSFGRQGVTDGVGREHSVQERRATPVDRRLGVRPPVAGRRLLGEFERPEEREPRSGVVPRRQVESVDEAGTAVVLGAGDEWHRALDAFDVGERLGNRGDGFELHSPNDSANRSWFVSPRA